MKLDQQFFLELWNGARGEFNSVLDAGITSDEGFHKAAEATAKRILSLGHYYRVRDIEDLRDFPHDGTESFFIAGFLTGVYAAWESGVRIKDEQRN